MSTLTRSREHLHVDELPFKQMFQALGSPSVRELSVREFVELAAEFVELAAKVAAPSPYLSGEITKTVEGLMLCTQQDSDLKHLARYLVADGLVAALRAGKADKVAALSRQAREYLQGSDRERFIACLDAAVGRAELLPDERVQVYERLNCLVASVPALAQVADGLVAALRAGKADKVAALSRRAREYLQGSDRERFIACLDAAVGRAELLPDEMVQVDQHLNSLVHEPL